MGPLQFLLDSKSVLTLSGPFLPTPRAPSPRPGPSLLRLLNPHHPEGGKDSSLTNHGTSAQVPTQPRLQLMSMILIMVMTKKGSGSKGTFTRMAVIRNTNRMATRVPRIRTDWGIL